MASLQRSAVSFRRQGSSGLVWEDRFFSGDFNQMKQKEGKFEFRELRQCQSAGSIGMMERNQSNRGHSPATDPPSLKVSGCGLCGFLGRLVRTHQPKTCKEKS